MIVSFQSLTAQSGAGMARLGYLLSQELDKQGLLNKFVIHSKGKYNTAFRSEPVSFFSRYYLFALNKLNKYLKIKQHKLRFIQELLFDWFCVFRLNATVTHLIATQPHLKRTFRKAKKMGIETIYIPGTQEDNYMFDIVSEEKQKMGVKDEDAYTYPRRIKHYNQSIQYVDEVICATPNIYKSFLHSNYRGKVNNITGYLMPEFMPVVIDRKPGKVFKVAYVAHTVMLKGLQYLLEAWNEIMEVHSGDDMMLYVGGGIDTAVRTYIDKQFGQISNVQYTGHIADVISFLKDKDLVVVPSLVDAYPFTAFEAAHYAVPVVITENCGAGDLLKGNNDGCWIIPVRDSKAIKEHILWAQQNPAEAAQKGLHAKANLDNYHTEDFIRELSDYLIGI